MQTKNIILLIFAFLLFVLASMFNAMMDIIDHKYSISVFSNCEWCYHDWERKYTISNKFLRRYFGLLLDGWHTFKILMIFCLVGSATLFSRFTHSFKWWVYIIIFMVLGTLCWNTVFTLFYDIILIRK